MEVSVRILAIERVVFSVVLGQLICDHYSQDGRVAVEWILPDMLILLAKNRFTSLEDTP